MRLLQLSLVFWLTAFLISVSAQPENTALSTAVSFDGEPSMAINPSNPQNIVAAWMGFQFEGGSGGIAVTLRSSFDGGNTWGSTVVIPHAGSSYTSADVSLAFDKNGLLYLSYIDYSETFTTGGDYIRRSLDGGLNWDSATQVTNITEGAGKDPIDRPWLVVDNSNTSNAGTVYITSKPIYWIPPPNRNYYKVSSDSGHTWSALANVDGGNYLVGNIISQPMAAPTTTINGNFCAVYPSYLSSQNIYPAYYLATSANKGQSFTYSTVIAALFTPVDTNLKSGYRLAADPADSNKLVFLEVDSSLGEPDIMAMHSNDGGQTWSSRLRVNDDPTGTGKDHDMVWCAYNGNGNLAVTWRDRRNSSVAGFWNAGYDFYYALSSDNGQTFSANQVLSSQFIAFDSVIAQKGNDFMSCAYFGDTLYSVWGDTRSGHMNIYFAKTIASTDSTLGIVVLQGDEQMVVFPNPANQILNIFVPQKMVGEKLFLFDSKGKRISENPVQSMRSQISLANLASGEYLIKIGGLVKKVIRP